MSATVETVGLGGVCGSSFKGPWLNRERLHEYLTKGGNPNAKVDESGLLLHYATFLGALAEVQALIWAGVEVERKSDKGQTALNAFFFWQPLGARTSRYDNVLALLEAGADVNSIDEYGNTALHHVAGFYPREPEDCVDDIVFLVEHGALVSAANMFGRQSIHKAAMMTRVETVRNLVGLGADVNALDKFELTPLHLVGDEGDGQGGRWWDRRLVPIAAELLRLGADVNLRDSAGRTPLYCAIQRFQSRERIGLIKTLLDGGADPNIGDERGVPPKNIAEYYGCLKTAALM